VFRAHYADDDIPNDPASLQWIDEKQRHLKWPVAFCKRLWGKNEVVVIEAPVRQQVGNECAIETINNILAAAAPASLSFTMSQ
jgi:hypothetical protein